MNKDPLLPARALAMALISGAVITLSGCGSAPPVANWQVEAKSAMERAVNAYLEGHAKVELAELRHARSALARTGQPQALAQAELLRCAAQVASLEFVPCTPFDALQMDASEAQRAYTLYLQAKPLSPTQATLLPPAQRPVASRSANDPTPLPASMEPLALLVAAGTLFQRAQCPPAVVDQAINVASAQGWRRPLLAWLGVRIQMARDAGQADSVARLERRRAIVQAAGTAP